MRNRRKPRLRGFTLIEATVALTITAVAASALLLGVTSSLHTTSDCLEQTIAAGMAQQVLDEVVGANRIEDYNALRRQPSVDPNFPVTSEYFDLWQQEVEVYEVDPADLTTRLAGSDYRAVEVRIVYVDPERGRRVLFTLRQVVPTVPAI